MEHATVREYRPQHMDRLNQIPSALSENVLIIIMGRMGMSLCFDNFPILFLLTAGDIGSFS